MLIFNKVLPLFFLPIGMVTGLVLFALWRKKWWPGLVALGLLYACSIPFVATRLIGGLEARYPVVRVADAGPADAVIVLGGILAPPYGPGVIPNWSEAVERFEAGVALVRADRAGMLVFTGARVVSDGRETTEGAELRLQAIARGVPPEKIIVTRLIDNTATEALAMAELMRARGWKRAIVVTSGWHMPRAAMLFRKAGVDFQPFPVDFRRDPGHRLEVYDFVPSGIAWQVTEQALRECYGYVFYRLFR